MCKVKLMEDLEAYVPFNEQEEKDKAFILHMIQTQPNICMSMFQSSSKKHSD